MSRSKHEPSEARCRPASACGPQSGLWARSIASQKRRHVQAQDDHRNHNLGLPVEAAKLCGCNLPVVGAQKHDSPTPGPSRMIAFSTPPALHRDPQRRRASSGKSGIHCHHHFVPPCGIPLSSGRHRRRCREPSVQVPTYLPEVVTLAMRSDIEPALCGLPSTW